MLRARHALQPGGKLRQEHDSGLQAAPLGRSVIAANGGERLVTDVELLRLAHHHAAHAVICFVLYGEEVIKNVEVWSRKGRRGRTTTYSRLPIPMVCRPPAGAPRRGNPAPVSADAIVDAHGVLSYAGMVGEHLHLALVERAAGEEPETSRLPAAVADRETLARIAQTIGLSRPADHFFEEYWQEARRLLRAHWEGVRELAQVLEERGTLHGDRVDALLLGVLAR